MKFLAGLRQNLIAVETKAAHEQHYKLPMQFHQLCLGGRMKYSGAHWPAGVNLEGDQLRPSPAAP
jgi:cyclopropane-fatty-acyl-phospholipid synthase